jgi:hypothetical protein
VFYSGNLNFRSEVVMVYLTNAKKTAAIVCLIFSSQMATASSAQSQSPSCGERDAILQRLSGTYAEKQVGAGVTADGRLLELFAAKSGSWTVLITYPGGPTCVATSGDGWRHLKLLPDGPLV